MSVAPHEYGLTARTVMTLAHCVVSFAWLVGGVLLQNRAAWFMSGTLVFTHFATAFWLVMPVVQARVDAMMLALRPTKTQLAAVRPESALSAQVLQGVLVCALAGLLFVAVYVANIVSAIVQPDYAHETTTVLLARALWAEERPLVVITLTLLGLTGLLHGADIAVAAAALAGSGGGPPTV